MFLIRILRLRIQKLRGMVMIKLVQNESRFGSDNLFNSHGGSFLVLVILNL